MRAQGSPCNEEFYRLKCVTCGSENSEGTQFCGSCGVPLETRAESAGSVSYCTACGTENPVGARFCGSCGAGMRVPAGPAAGPEPAQADVPRAHMGFWIRFAAGVIDWITLFAALVILTLIFGGFAAFLELLILILYVVQLGLRGQTLGKQAVGIKVVTWEGEVPGVGRAVVREVIGKFVSGIVFLLGYIWVAFDGQKQGWHDKMAGTYVVKT